MINHKSNDNFKNIILETSYPAVPTRPGHNDCSSYVACMREAWMDGNWKVFIIMPAFKLF